MNPPGHTEDRDSPAAAPARNIRLTVEYDGTDFSGWQRQPGFRTVQACLEQAVRAMTGESVLVRGAGRTDAGVHAAGQVANFRTSARIPGPGFLRGLNAHLPGDIAVIDLQDAAPDFDARLSARGKTYVYRIWNHLTRSPLLARSTWHFRAPLDLGRMRDTAGLFVGEHDFRAFRAADCERRTTRRILRRVDLRAQGVVLTVEIEGTAFLKNMVRILAGTLVAVGRGALSPEQVAALLESGDRTQAGPTAPARGLCLLRVHY